MGRRTSRPALKVQRSQLVGSYKCSRCTKSFGNERVRDSHETAVHVVAQTEPQPRPEQGDPDNPRGDGRQS